MKNKDLDIKQFGALAQKSLTKIKTYSTFLFVLSILLIYVFLVFRISTLASSEPDDDAITEKANTVKRLKLDQDAISKIQQLEDQNVGVKSLFETARENPFQE